MAADTPGESGGPVALGITLGTLNPRVWRDAAVVADELGFESVFVSDHVVFPERMTGALDGREHPVPSTTPLMDSIATLSHLAGITTRVRLGTFVYLLGLRHPFIAARGFATLDVLSGGRARCGVGAGWLTSEWDAVGLDPGTRGRRLDESIDLCRQLWSEDVVSHAGLVEFEPVRFEPKPVQEGGPPVLVGGQSPAALRRAARLGDGWLGMGQPPDDARALVHRLHELRVGFGRGELPFSTTVMGQVDGPETLDAYADAGIDRVIVSPWTSSRDAVSAMEALAARIGL